MRPCTAAEQRRRDRLSKARRLQVAMELRHDAERENRQRRARNAALPVVPDLDATTAAVLTDLPLDAHRYGLARHVHAQLVQMHCADLADVARLGRGRLDNWLGYAACEAVCARLAAIVAEIRAGHPEPGILRIWSGLETEARLALSGRPITDLIGPGLPEPLIQRLAASGYPDLAALADAEVDVLLDQPDVGPSRIARLRDRLQLCLPVGRSGTADRAQRDAEWEAAAPPGKPKPRA
jgi:hypothetical protein